MPANLESIAEELALVMGKVERLQRALDDLKAAQEPESAATDVEVKEPAPARTSTSTPTSTTKDTKSS